MAAVDGQQRRHIAQLGHDLVHDVQPIRVRVRQGTQDDGVDDAEDGGIGADAERQRRDGDSGEARSAPEHPRSDARVLEPRVEKRRHRS
jgi:hypothetical protein